MAITKHPFLDPTKTYEDNYKNGPFGEFAHPVIYRQTGEPTYTYHGHKVFLPFGIPAGPILNSNYVKSAFELGFDIVVYKTVRSYFFPTHPFPNILSVHVDGDLTLSKLKKPVVADTNYSEPISITNSYGVPSRSPDIWQEDVKKALSYAGEGQVLVLSFMGTAVPDQTQAQFVDDFALSAKLALETGATILETDISCPNFGEEGMVCYDMVTTERICKAIRKVISKVPFILKVGYYPLESDLEALAAIANEYADGVAGINTLQAEIRTLDGKQALPGAIRIKSGVTGAAIKWAGLDFVKRLAAIREKKGYTFKIEGVGGVLTPNDYKEYMQVGADSVMSATGAMWNPFLAQEIKSGVKNGVKKDGTVTA